MTERKERAAVPVCEWEFDDWSTLHWQEKREGKIDKTKSWIEFSDTENGQRATVFSNRKAGLTIDADIDQWGTWLTFKIGDSGHTIAQEHGTKSFIDAMIAALTKLKDIVDCGEGEPPVLTVYEVCKTCNGDREIVDPATASNEYQNWIDCPDCTADK
jgi:hypothetical protein